jgi:hypothetical protein
MQKHFAALGLCVALAACSSSSSINRGKAGESCTSHNDCSGSLGCYNGICAATAPSGEEDGGTPVAVLSQEGESCTRRADCDTGLMCFDQTCVVSAPVPPPPADAGTNTSAGIRGETCRTNADCSPSLVCIPNPTNQSIGVCDLANYSIVQGGKTCSAECKADIDCCELPIGESGVAGDAGTVNYNSCADLKKVLNQADPSGCEADPASPSRECFLYKTYCDCATSNPWQCKAATGTCSYTKICTGNGEIIKGCPLQTRTGIPTVSTCNIATNTCAAAATKAGCASNDDCTNTFIADAAGEKCVSGECVCATGGACYRKCNVDLDCAKNYTCKASLCTFSGECTTDLDCVQKSGDITSVCAKDNTCKKPCAIDQDCGPSGVAGTKFKNLICGTDHYCADITGQCSSDDDCGATASNGQLVKKFCVATTAVASVTYASAITATK